MGLTFARVGCLPVVLDCDWLHGNAWHERSVLEGDERGAIGAGALREDDHGGPLRLVGVCFPVHRVAGSPADNFLLLFAQEKPNGHSPRSRWWNVSHL